MKKIKRSIAFVLFLCVLVSLLPPMQFVNAAEVVQRYELDTDGIDVGATNTKIGLFDNDMNLLDYAQTLTDQEADLTRLMDFIDTLVRRLVQKNELTMDDLVGVGVALPSYIDHENGIVRRGGRSFSRRNRRHQYSSGYEKRHAQSRPGCARIPFSD